MFLFLIDFCFKMKQNNFMNYAGNILSLEGIK